MVLMLDFRKVAAMTIKITETTVIFTTSASFFFENRPEMPWSGLRRLRSGMTGLRLATQPPAVMELRMMAAMMMTAKTTLPMSPASTMSCRRESMVPVCKTVVASKESCWLRASLRRSNRRGDSVITAAAPAPRTARCVRSVERAT